MSNKEAQKRTLKGNVNQNLLSPPWGLLFHSRRFAQFRGNAEVSIAGSRHGGGDLHFHQASVFLSKACSGQSKRVDMEVIHLQNLRRLILKYHKYRHTLSGIKNSELVSCKMFIELQNRFGYLSLRWRCFHRHQLANANCPSYTE